MSRSANALASVTPLRSKDESDYVAGKAPPYRVQPPIVHPPLCVCAKCADLPDDERLREHVVRTNRISKFPGSRTRSAIYAIDVKRQLERELREAVEEAQRRTAAGPVVTFGQACDAYRKHQRDEGKRLDVNEYTIRALEQHFGRDIPAASISKTDYREWAEAKRTEVTAETVGRHTRIFLAILNSAVRDGLIAAHQLNGIRRPIVGKRKKKPVIFTRRQVEVLHGPAMDRYEAELRRKIDAYDSATRRRPPTEVPLRWFCLVAYRTLMRPGNNFGLEWSQLAIDEETRTGRFKLDDHKNVTRGVEVEAPLHRELVDYLLALRRSGRKLHHRYVHPNPLTGKPYRNIDDNHWKRLVEIANEILAEENAVLLTGVRTHFYTWRHTGASRLAESGADPVLIVRMMGDTDLETVRAHYFDSSLDHMQRIMEEWA